MPAVQRMQQRRGSRSRSHRATYCRRTLSDPASWAAIPLIIARRTTAATLSLSPQPIVASSSSRIESKSPIVGHSGHSTSATTAGDGTSPARAPGERAGWSNQGARTPPPPRSRRTASACSARISAAAAAANSALRVRPTAAASRRRMATLSCRPCLSTERRWTTCSSTRFASSWANRASASRRAAAPAAALACSSCRPASRSMSSSLCHAHRGPGAKSSQISCPSAEPNVCLQLPTEKRDQAARNG